jgi:DNA-binding transcriptional ArsR family regulator
MPAPMQPKGQNDDVHRAVVAIGNGLRAAIIHELRQGPLLGPELNERLSLPSGTVTPQLAVLRDLGVVVSEAQAGRGRPTLHTLNQAQTRELLEALGAYLLGDKLS